MTTNEKRDPTTTPEGTVEIEEAQLDQVSGGLPYLKLGGIDGESQIQKVPGLTTRP